MMNLVSIIVRILVLLLPISNVTMLCGNRKQTATKVQADRSKYKMIEQNHLWDIPEDETDVIVKKAI